MKNIIVCLFLLLFTVPAFAQVTSTPSSIIVPILCKNGTLAQPIPLNLVFSGSGNLQAIAAVTDNYIKTYRWWLQSTVDVQLQFTQGTGTNCATGNAVLTQRIDPFSTANRPVDSELLNPPLVTTAISKALCLNSSAAATITGALFVCQEP